MDDRIDAAMRAEIDAIGDPGAEQAAELAREAAELLSPDEKRRKPSERALERRPVPLDPDTNPWDRQPRETAKAYEAFCRYRDSDHRNVARLMAEGGTAQYRTWSSKWQWSGRALSWDRFLTTKDLEDAMRWRRTMNNRQRRAAALAQSKIIEWLRSLDPVKLTPTEAARWFEVAVKVERLAAGGETAKVEVGGDLRIDSMSAEDVAVALQRLQTEIGKVVDSEDPADVEPSPR